MIKRLSMLLAVCCMLAAFSVPAYALEYNVGAPDDYLFGTPTSDNTIYVATGEAVNKDRSKNAAFAPPTFGSPTSYTLNSGELLTPNLVGGTTTGGSSSGGVTVMPPTVSGSTSSTVPNGYGQSSTWTTGYTEVTSDLYYSGGHLGTLSIPTIGLTVKIYQGTDSAALAKGAGHFTDTSIWDGNVCLAGHNRGVNNHFGKIHTLAVGDTITLTTKLGTRSYSVISVEKVLETDTSGTAATAGNQITLYTCVMNEREYRWRVCAVEI